MNKHGSRIISVVCFFSLPHFFLSSFVCRRRRRRRPRGRCGCSESYDILSQRTNKCRRARFKHLLLPSACIPYHYGLRRLYSSHPETRPSFGYYCLVRLRTCLTISTYKQGMMTHIFRKKCKLVVCRMNAIDSSETYLLD